MDTTVRCLCCSSGGSHSRWHIHFIPPSQLSHRGRERGGGGGVMCVNQGVSICCCFLMSEIKYSPPLPGASHLLGLWSSRERHHETPAQEPPQGQAGEREAHQHRLRTDRWDSPLHTCTHSAHWLIVLLHRGPQVCTSTNYVLHIHLPNQGRDLRTGNLVERRI